MSSVKFEFGTAGRVLFGPGALREVGQIARELGRTALIVTGKGIDRARPLLERLEGAGLSYTIFGVRGEPTFEDVVAAIDQVKQWKADLVIGFGGGSAIDTAKAVSALATNPGEVIDYVEVIGRGKSLVDPPLPCIAIPTTSGTGAEVTKNSVLLSETHKVKVSLRHHMLLPRVAIVDPELTYSLSRDVTARTGCDALTQLIEAYVSVRANPITDALCEEGLRRVGRSLRRAVENGMDYQARYDMALASLLSGMALANAGLGAVHGLAGPVGGLTRIPHGAVCAALLPHVMKLNVAKLRKGGDELGILGKYAKVASLLTGDPHATADSGIKWVEDLVKDFQLHKLRSNLLTPPAIKQLAAQALQSGSMKSNPVQLDALELEQLLGEVVY